MRTLFAPNYFFYLRCVLVCCVLAWLAGCGSKSSPSSSPYANAKAQHVVTTAHKAMGTKYRSGGDAPHKGFDCSGLIWWAYHKNGIAVPRITRDQAIAGISVPQHKARHGDIVVFRTRQGPQGLHTGMYAGDGNFIHSPRKGERVRMESLEIPYWRDKLVAVRRVIP